MLPPVLFDQFAGTASRTWLRDPCPVEPCVTPRRGQSPRSLHPHVQVVLHGVGDGAVALQGVANDERGGVGCRRFGHGDVATRGVEIVRHRVRGVVHNRLGELDGQQRVGEMVLDRLEAPDRHTELLALLHVLGGHREHAVGQPDELGRRAERASIEGVGAQASRVRRRRDRQTLTSRSHSGEMARPVDRGLAIQLHLVDRVQRDSFGREVHDRSRNIGVQNQGHRRRPPRPTASPLASRCTHGPASSDPLSASSGTATAVVSSNGSGSAARPASSSRSTRSSSRSPSPPRCSGAVSPTTPRSARPCHSSSECATPVSHAARPFRVGTLW